MAVNAEQFEATEMSFYVRMLRISRMDYVGNEKVSKKMETKKSTYS